MWGFDGERRTALLAEVARAFRETPSDLQLACDAVAGRLASLTGEGCALGILDRRGGLALRGAGSDDPGLLAVLRAGSAPRPGDLLLERLARERRPLRLPLAEGLAGWPGSAELARRHRLTHLLGAPMLLGADAVGAVALLRPRDPAPHSDQEEAFLVELAERAALALDNARLLAAEREARERVERSEAHYRQLFEQGPSPMWVYDVGTLGFLAINEAAVAHFGWSRAELARMKISDFHPPEEVPKLLRTVADAEGAPRRGLWRQWRKDGEPLWTEVSSQSFWFEGRRARLVVATDVTDKHELEAQLRQAQKMEAIGRLAGGVAHDFNNLLSVILTYSQTLPRQLPEGSPAVDDLREIQKAGERAAALTRQLLSFSRQALVEPRLLALNELLASLEKMLRRLIGEDVELSLRLGEGLWGIRADPGQLDQVVMNLAVNARDAMPTGGRLAIETANVDLDEEHARSHLGVVAGPHVLLAVSDTGVGMDRETQARIFEPFFTTKPPGKGTGLGLSTVFGIVRQSGGSIWVHSEPGHGTRFEIYFPRAEGPRGNETVLLVEDDDQVRAVARSILDGAGYRVLEARDGLEALRLGAASEGAIDLLLTDVVMPRMSGPELAQRLAATWPRMRLLCLSGYTGEAVVNHGLLGNGAAFLQKPLTPERLLRKVREVLGGSPAA